jgi:predicted tellurium resistance membrane protein TerC
MLALSFLLLIGFTLIVEGFHQHISKGYNYFAMGFAVLVEMLNLRLRQASARPVNLRDPYKQSKVVTEGPPVSQIAVKTPAKKKPTKKRK